ncbi:MAG TPA: glutamyl-tRNA reductase [Cyclobacteriaceae bacterium]|nr:glutamyl-tRNA reductase [Cyclobacteriaceae bacterium]
MAERVADKSLVVAGVSFKTTELYSRSRFAFNAETCRYAYADSSPDLSFFILSTCNRTEVYAWTDFVEPVLEILQRQGQCTAEELNKIVYVREGAPAVDHFFRVAAGLESQIIGDYDIISQIKTAFKGAKEQRRANGILEKMFNFALQASKEVKNSTLFSDGTMSVPYAVVKQLLGRNDIRTITVAGAGETGELVIKYIRSYLPYCDIRLVNRDEDRLQSLASKYDVMQFPIAALGQSLAGSDVLIVTTNASGPIVERNHVEGTGLKLIFDLSVPRNVSPNVYRMNIPVLDTDKISDTIQNNINNRLSEIPKVEAIISEHSAAFGDWMKRRESFTVNP